MKSLINNGGERAGRVTADNQHKVKKRSFSNDNGGTIAGNVISIGNTCFDNRRLAKQARGIGLPVHSATFPVNLARFLIKWLCPKGGLVAAPFGGWSTVGAAAEGLGMPWVTCELHWEYIKASLLRINTSNGYHINPKFNELEDLSCRVNLATA
jgi:site-specific DNA-methyltransferase (cytosine-N4-specific)